MSTPTAVLEPCPNARSRKRLAAGRWRFEFKCKPDCLMCHGKASVITCPDCDGCGLVRGALCNRCQTRGKIPAQLPEE